jgi:predicted alpha/beta superfamily hydrolase
VRPLAAADGSHEYRLFVATPAEAPPPQGFPIVYVLDANATFATIVEAIRMRCHRPATTGVVPAIVAGIGHAIDGPYERERRRIDFTPAVSDVAGVARDGLLTGGPARFFDLLTQVQDAVEAELPVDRSRRALFGHSLGGLFATSVLLERPAAFARYVVVSPSLWWSWEAIAARAETLADRVPASSASVTALFTVGEFEEVLAPWEAQAPTAAEMRERRAARQMVSRCRALAGILARAGSPLVSATCEEAPAEDHASAALIGINRGLRFALWPGPSLQK